MSNTITTKYKDCIKRTLIIETTHWHLSLNINDPGDVDKAVLYTCLSISHKSISNSITTILNQ